MTAENVMMFLDGQTDDVDQHDCDCDGCKIELFLDEVIMLVEDMSQQKR